MNMFENAPGRVFKNNLYIKTPRLSKNRSVILKTLFERNSSFVCARKGFRLTILIARFCICRILSRRNDEVFPQANSPIIRYCQTNLNLIWWFLKNTTRHYQRVQKWVIPGTVIVINIYFSNIYKNLHRKCP